MDDLTRDHGPQPLEMLMTRWGLENHDLVDISDEQLTYKQVQRAKSGRQLTLKMMMKVARTFNAAVLGKLGKLGKEDVERFDPYNHKDLFSYSKGYDAAKADRNAGLDIS